MMLPRYLRRLPRWAIAALAIALLAGSAQTVWALSCVPDRDEQLTLELESVTVDGVAQEDLSGYAGQTYSLATFFSADRLLLSYGEPDAYAEVFVMREGGSDE